jgi:outer membrane receptor protein involved in Fe transport
VDADGSAGNYWTVSGPLPARLLVGAGASLAHAPSGLTVRASAYNLGNSRVQDFPGYPLPGRTFFLALEWSSAVPSQRPSTPTQ